VREGKFYEWLTGVLQLQIVDVSFGASENYATGGIDVASPIKAVTGFQEIHGLAVLWHNVGGWLAVYNSGTGKIQFFGEGTNTDGVVALSEMADDSTAVNGKVVRVLVIGS
jgi:hypothetical protein